MNKIQTRINLNETVNNLKLWDPFCTEYEKLNINPNHQPQTHSLINNNDATKYVLDVQNMIKVMIDEQILLVLCTTFDEYEIIIKWLKTFYKSIYHKILNQSNMQRKVIQIALTITGKIRLVFKNDSTSIIISDSSLMTITKRINQFIEYSEIMETAWNDVKQYRFEYNQQIMTNSDLLNQIQIGLSKSNKMRYTINEKYSILTHWALLRHKNQANSIYKMKNKKSIDKYINLKKQQSKYKIGKGGAYSTDSVFKQLEIISTNNLCPDQLKPIGQGIYNMMPKPLKQFCPPLMCGNTVRQYQTVQMNWYYKQINAVMFKNRSNPVVNGAIDAATFKGNWASKVLPIELTAYDPRLKCGFTWTHIYQPINPTEETGYDLFSKLKQFTDKFPVINELNAIANDDGPTSRPHIALQRETNPLLIEILDTAHLFNTVIKIGITEVWGRIQIKTKNGTVTKALVPTNIKLTSKKIEKHKILLCGIVQYYSAGEFRKNEAGSDTRFSGNIGATDRLISKRLINVRLYADYDDDYSETDEVEDINNQNQNIPTIKCTDVDVLKSTEPIQLINLLPELSDNEKQTLSFQKVKSKFKSKFESPHKNRINIDKKLYNKHQHLESFTERNLTFDIKRFVLILEIVVTNPECGAQLKDFWIKRPNCGAIVTIHAVGQAVIKPIIDLCVHNRNRIIELYPLIAKKFQILHELRYAVQYLVNQFGMIEIQEAIEYILETYSLHFRSRCARLYRKSHLFKWCSNHKNGSKQYPCNDKDCIRNHASPKLNLLNKLLPPKSSGFNIKFIKKLFTNVIQLKSFYNQQECEYILTNICGDVFAWTTSDIFANWNDLDGLTVLEAKVVIYVQLLRFVEFGYYKFVERWTHILEGGICCSPLIRHPKLGLIFASNIINIGQKTWIQRSSRHVKLKQYQFIEILQQKVSNGYAGGMKYVHNDIWNLISQFAQQNDWTHLIVNPRLSLLLDFVDEHCVCINNTINIEKMNKPLKEMYGAQTNSEININRRMWGKFNLKKGLFHHPIVYLFTKKRDVSDIKVPEQYTELCQMLNDVPSNETFHQNRKEMIKLPTEFVHIYKDPKIAKGKNYDTTKALKNIGTILNPLNNKHKRRLQIHNIANKRKKLNNVLGQQKSREINNIIKLPMAVTNTLITIYNIYDPQKRKTNHNRNIRSLRSSTNIPISRSTASTITVNKIYNPQTYKIKKWCNLTLQIQKSITSTIGISPNICKDIWNKIVSGDMIHMYLVETAMKMAAKQNTSLDLGFGVSGKPNDLRLLNCFGANVLFCGSFPHFVLIQRNVDGDILFHDSIWSDTNITDYVQINMSKLCGQYGQKCIDFNVVVGQQQSNGSLLCAIYCVAKLTEMIYGNDNFADIYFKETKMRAHFAFCVASGKLTPFPRQINDYYRIIAKKIKLICICNKPKCFDKQFKLCIKCNIVYHWKCMCMDFVFIKSSICNLCITNDNNLKLCGLTNFGNTCFCNSTLQICLNTSTLRKYYYNNDNRQHHSTELDRQFSIFFQTQKIKNLVSHLKENIYFKHLFTQMKQQDASEILVIFQQQLNSTVILQSFGGLFQSILTCQDPQCKERTPKVESFTIVSVPIQWNREIGTSIKMHSNAQYLNGLFLINILQLYAMYHSAAIVINGF